MTDLQSRLDRLRRLGLRRGAAHLRPEPETPTPQKPAVGIEEVVAGRTLHTPAGTCFLAEHSWPLSHRHGDLPLAAALEVPPGALAHLAGLPAGESFDLRQTLFFDIETSGLSGGAGTYVFEIGAGFFEDDAFCVQQFFMRDLTEEPAYLHAIGGLLDRFEALVTFNGRSFDLPMLNARFTLARQPRRLVRAPHLDLLTPARRLWRRRLDSCSLGALERQVLGVTRGEEEVPGWLVPRLYFDYMQTGDASELAGVFYHNLIDVLSMVTLTARLGAIFHDPHAAGPLDGLDLFSLGRWYESLGMVERSEAAYRAALDRPLDEGWSGRIWRRLSFLLKRQERRKEAAAIWRDVIRREGRSGVYAHVELAKHCEWQVGDLPAAAQVTRQAIALLNDGASDRRSQETLAELTHRLERLERKLARSGRENKEQGDLSH
jgi:hypothetical protein